MNLSPAFLTDLLVKGTRGFEPKDARLPDDTEIIDVSWADGLLQLTLESESFEPIRPGALVPILPDPTFVCKDFVGPEELIDG